MLNGNDMPSTEGETVDFLRSIRPHALAGRTAFIVPAPRPEEARHVSYDDFYQRVSAYAAGADRLLRPGFAPGEARFVGIRLPRSVDGIALFLGLMEAGFCPSFMEPRVSWPVIAERMAAVVMKVLVTDEDDVGVPEGVRVYRSSALLSRERRQEQDVSAGSGDEPAMLLFTSGSTGNPKGIVLSHRNLRNNARGVIAVTRITPADRLLHLMPLHHTNGVNNQIIAPLLQGATVILADRFRAERVPSWLSDYAVTYMTGVPTIYSRVLAVVKALPHPLDVKSLRFLRCGSALLAESLHRDIEAAFGVELLVSYGLSEATCTSTMNPPGGRKIGTVGQTLPGQQVALFSPGGWNAAAEGEICIRGDSLMRGYVGSDGAPSPIECGWLRTGDIGRFDGEGFLTITGRLKNLIVRGGENISPELIENILLKHPAVRNCCVVGRHCADLGEVPVAFVEPVPGDAPDERELDNHIKAFLPASHAPAGYYWLEKLPENAVGKIDRKQLRSRLG
ncbi:MULTISPECIES: class I adenylate-forming enzyme family protein [Brenneria]|nr:MULTISPECIES: class I adenylate-forming enzyme family protein [Brenneria]EHD23406.1 o-succinylbenzoate--CoA ligase [Brenneria sp. EniD312]